MPELERQPHIIHILVDDREANSRTFNALSEIEDTQVRSQRLLVGDYEIDGRLLFERKTLVDFAASIKDGRLFRQALRLVNNPIRGAIILEGTASDLSSTGMRREAIQGALISLSLVRVFPYCERETLTRVPDSWFSQPGKWSALPAVQFRARESAQKGNATSSRKSFRAFPASDLSVPTVCLKPSGL